MRGLVNKASCYALRVNDCWLAGCLEQCCSVEERWRCLNNGGIVWYNCGVMAGLNDLDCTSIEFLWLKNRSTDVRGDELGLNKSSCRTVIYGGLGLDDSGTIQNMSIAPLNESCTICPWMNHVSGCEIHALL